MTLTSVLLSVQMFAMIPLLQERDFGWWLLQAAKQGNRGSLNLWCPELRGKVCNTAITLNIKGLCLSNHCDHEALGIIFSDIFSFLVTWRSSLTTERLTVLTAPVPSLHSCYVFPDCHFNQNLLSLYYVSVTAPVDGVEVQ